MNALLAVDPNPDTNVQQLPRFQRSPKRLEDRRHQLAARFPRPSEAVLHDQSEKIGQLLSQVREIHTAAEAIQLAKQLPSRDIQLILPALALPDSADLPAKVIDRLMIILRERACPSLYPKAWVIWQQAYPHTLLTKALSVLCGILEIKKATSKPPVHERTPLISSLVELHGQNISRHLVSHLVQRQKSLTEAMSQFAIDPAWSFGSSLLLETFTHATATLFAEQIGHLGVIFQSASAEKRARIMRHFLSLTDLPEPVKQQAHVVFYLNCSDPGSGTPVWSLLHNRERKAFSSWVTRARIGSHCLDYPEKAHFYLRYADHIRRTENWDSQTLLLYFDTFVIADDNRYPDQALYYKGQEPSPHPHGLANPDHQLSPGSPAIAHRRMETAIQQNDLSGIIQLQFDPEGIKQAGVIIDISLPKMGRRPIFGKDAGNK